MAVLRPAQPSFSPFYTGVPSIWLPPGLGAGGAGVSGTAQASKDFTNIFDTNGHNHIWRAVVGADFVYAGASAFVLTPAACLLTYTGDDQDFLVVLSATFEASGGAVQGTSGIAIALSGDLVGGEMFGDTPTLAGAMYSDLISGGALALTSQRRVALTTGSTLQPIGAKFDADDDLKLHALSLSLLEV